MEANREVMEYVVPKLSERIGRGLRNGLQTALHLLKFILPLYVAVDLLNRTPLMGALARAFAPLMKHFGLPGETALAFLAAIFVNNYAAIAILANLHLNVWQVTQCGLMMGIAHELVLEGGVLKSTGTQGGFLSLFRLVLAVACGLLFALLTGLRP